MFSNVPFIASYTCFMDAISLYPSEDISSSSSVFFLLCGLFLISCFFHLFLSSMLAPSSSPHCLLVFEWRHKKADGKFCVQTGFTTVFTAEWSSCFHRASPTVRSLGLFSWAGHIPRKTLFQSPIRRTSAQLLTFWEASGGKGWSAPSSGHPLPLHLPPHVCVLSSPQALCFSPPPYFPRKEMLDETW